MHEKTDDKILIEGLKHGKEEAYRMLYQKYYKLLCFIAYEFVNDYYIAETLVSDLTYSLWENRQSLQIRESLHAYLVKSIRYRSLNYLDHREKQEQLKQSVNEIMENKQSSYDRQEYYPLYTLIEKELEEKIEKAMNELPENTRKIFLLSRDEGLKYEEIAEITGMSVDSVKYHIKSALKQLRCDLKDYLVCWVVLFHLI